MSTDPLDCIVVGAGPAGLSAALFLVRYRHKVLTFHHNSPRNIYSHGVHGFLGHHGILPVDLLKRGRDEVCLHGGLLIEGYVKAAERVGDGCFRVTTGGEATVEQSFEARRLVLATGLRDLTPTCPGFREFYGQSVFHCPDCDGFEMRDKHIAVMGSGKRVVGFALNLLTWTNRLTILTNGEPDGIPPEFQPRLDRFAIPVKTEPIAALEGSGAQLQRVRFSNNDVLECDALFFTLGTEPASDLHVQLGCEVDTDTGLVCVDAHQETSVPGVYAAGDLTPNSQLAVVAAAEGAMAAIQIHKSLAGPERTV